MPRTETVTRTLFKFEELSDKAKEKARDWWRETENELFGHEYPNFMTEDWVSVGEALGFTFKMHKVIPYGGEKFARYEPNIWWSMHTQGSGVCFEGSYQHKKGGAWKALKKHAPQDEKLAEIAANLDNLQRLNTWGVGAKITAGDRHYTHEHSVDIELVRVRAGSELPIKNEDEFKEAFRDLMRWMRDSLNAEYTHRMSDESVDESMDCNGYEFTEDGKRA